MKNIRCIIVDDEPIAAQVIQNYLNRLNGYEIAAVFHNALKAFEFLQQHPVDLIFLDIQMPGITGLDFIRSLRNPPKIIIVSAYREFAFEGFELEVLDYLLKPVSFDRFLKAVDKYNTAVTRGGGSESDPISPSIPEEPYLWIRADRKNVRINTEHILYIEGLKDYVKIFMEGNMVICKMPLKKLETILPMNRFLRIHRSYLIPVSKITAYNNDGIEIGQVELPIGKVYRESVLSFLENYK